ncbi:ATP-binding protein [Thermosynechococcus sp. QKsg1]|uniref:sensor histidine kinase n=2 Tax=Thermosynechococcus TaxID=146785 RepID=UPI0028780EA8|nr:ATP-binding protein [Thermosynechococcus sp. QKsg1]WNC86630.1 ATP-binding protein [Thermosynechococcus sp. QKsg1]
MALAIVLYPPTSSPMFTHIRRRLLFFNLLVFAVVLGGFAIAVRVVFVHNLREQLTNRLIAIAQGAAANADIENGQLKIEEHGLPHELKKQAATLEWFDAHGRLLKQQGEELPYIPLNPKVSVAIHTHDPPLQLVTLPILHQATNEIIGYIRISQELDEFNETVWQLDTGLMAGVMIGLLLSAMGSLWLNRQAMQPIEDSFERLRQFTADASHELRSPLMAISSNAEVALKYDEGMRPEDREVLGAIASATDQMTRLIDDLLILARTDCQQPMAMRTINLAETLAQLIQLYKLQAQQQQISLEFSTDPQLLLRGDEAALIRAFTNLLQNALRYTPEGGKVSVTAKRLMHHIHVTIADTGIGIASEHLSKIFERFWRADPSRHYVDGGAGLGLSIVQAVVQSHGGSIDVKSQVGQGTSFTVRLPLSH